MAPAEKRNSWNILAGYPNKVGILDLRWRNRLEQRADKARDLVVGERHKRDRALGRRAVNDEHRVPVADFGQYRPADAMIPSSPTLSGCFALIWLVST